MGSKIEEKAKSKASFSTEIFLYIDILDDQEHSKQAIKLQLISLQQEKKNYFVPKRTQQS